MLNQLDTTSKTCKLIGEGSSNAGVTQFRHPTIWSTHASLHSLHVFLHVLLLLFPDLLRIKSSKVSRFKPHWHLLTLLFHLFAGFLVIDDSEADVSSFERTDIVGTISTHHGYMPFFIQHGYYPIFLIGGSSAEYVDVFNVLRSVLVSNKLLQYLSINAKHVLLAQFLNFFPTLRYFHLYIVNICPSHNSLVNLLGE